MIGMVLAAGAGRRLHPYTDTVPKTLVPVDGDRTILDVSLANFAKAGLTDVAIVTGYKAQAIEDRVADLERTHGVSLETVFNDKAEEWNNCYSLWCARSLFADGVVLVNGDTVAPLSVTRGLLDAAGRGDDLVLALDDVKTLTDESMKVKLSGAGLLTEITKHMPNDAGAGEYIGLTLIEPIAHEILADALHQVWNDDPQLYYEDGFGELATRGGRVGVVSIGDAEWTEVDDAADLERAREIALPLLSRMIGTPLAVEIGAGAVASLAPLLRDRRISAGGHVAVAVGPGQGEAIGAVLRPQLDRTAEIETVQGGSIEAAMALAATLRAGFYDAVVGIGGGRTIDTAKYAATMAGLPMVAVATSLAHDGIASPVASLEHDGRKGSYGVQMPIAVMVDLDYVRAAPADLRRAGIGDVVSNLGAVADWRLAGRARGENVDGLAATFAHTAALSIVDRRDGIEDPAFLIALAEALVLGGLAMATAGSSRPCSGGDHEILHAIDAQFPGAARHGELAGLCSAFTASLRDDPTQFHAIDACLERHGLPRAPADIGLTTEQFSAAVVAAPGTRPDRYTILEHLDLRPEEVRRRVDAFAAAVDR